MGKPFSKELDNINETLTWVSEIDIKRFSDFFNKFNSPLYIVGSGGSLSACYYFASLATSKGIIAQAITPLELFNVRKTIKNSVVIFISASGKNNDILFGFKTVIKEEPKGIACICMVENSPLAELAQKYSICEVFQYLLPTGKDGFLATNSLVAFYAILSKAFNTFNFNTDRLSLENDIENFIESINPDFTFFVLYSGWGTSVAIDIESKCTEAALSNVSISDYRNFGHGRHHWFAKRKNQSAVIALITPQEEELALKTLKELPSDIPKLILKSKFNDSTSSIELLIKSFSFINELGKIQNIDPGKPGVPAFGRKLYNLRYQSSFQVKSQIKNQKKCLMSIQRKLQLNSLDVLSNEKMLLWTNHYNSYMKDISKQTYGSIIFDYDGTLCSSKERFTGLSAEITTELSNILNNGFVVGVVTGRGKSVKEAIRKAIPNKKLWNQIIVGYYNGAQIGSLDINSLPDVNVEVYESLDKIHKMLNTLDNPFDLSYTLRPNQLTIENGGTRIWEIAKSYAIQKIKTAKIYDIQILESSHSVDIIPCSTSKTDIIKFCSQKASELGKVKPCLSIGDKGQWPGNDFNLLNNSRSLSVDSSSPSPSSAWNVASVGLKNVEATLEYLRSIKFETVQMKLNISK